MQPAEDQTSSQQHHEAEEMKAEPAMAELVLPASSEPDPLNDADPSMTAKVLQQNYEAGYEEGKSKLDTEET